MFLAYGGAADVNKQVNDGVSLVSRVVWPALATLVPVGVTTLFKWAQEHSGTRMRVQLTERVSVLAKAIADLPPEPAVAAALSAEPGEFATVAVAKTTTPKVALSAELDAVLRELTALQARTASRRSTPGFSAATAVSKVRSALLLYKPETAVAWMLHITFFCYLAVLGFALIAISSPDTPKAAAAPAATAGGAKPGVTKGTAQTSTQEDVDVQVVPVGTFTRVVAFIFIFGIAGIPPMVIRFYAAKIHRRQMMILAAKKDRPAPIQGAAVPSAT